MCCEINHKDILCMNTFAWLCKFHPYHIQVYILLIKNYLHLKLKFFCYLNNWMRNNNFNSLQNNIYSPFLLLRLMCHISHKNFVFVLLKKYFYSLCFVIYCFNQYFFMSKNMCWNKVQVFFFFFSDYFLQCIMLLNVFADDFSCLYKQISFVWLQDHPSFHLQVKPRTGTKCVPINCSNKPAVTI